VLAPVRVALLPDGMVRSDQLYVSGALFESDDALPLSVTVAPTVTFWAGPAFAIGNASLTVMITDDGLLFREPLFTISVAVYWPILSGVKVGAKRKRLPVCLCVWTGGRLIPLPLALRGAPAPPRGRGNVVALDSEAVASFAEETVRYLRQLEKHFGVSIRRIAIDAPSEPRADRLTRRLAETALDQRQISCFATPSAAEFEIIRRKVRDHLSEGGLESRLPHANQLWMLVGFALFNVCSANGIVWRCTHKRRCAF
jgi:hypothetical protein